MEFNISPETLLEEKYPSVDVDKLLNKEVIIKDVEGKCVCANGSMFDTTKKGIFPELVEKIFTDRQIYKKQMLEAKKQYEKSPSKKLEKEISRCNNIQMARKIQLNSLYGSIGTPYFRYYKLENAEAITLSGQVAIRWIESKMNVYLNKILKTDDVDYVIASDTDSVVGETLVYENGNSIKIEDLYEKYCNDKNLVIKRDCDDYIHDVSNIDLHTKSYDNGEIVEDRVIRIMKHKVKKKFYKITVNNNEIILTEDHSLIVEREGKLISIKPTEVLYNDIFINITDTGLCLKTEYKNE
jgi:DNA polymerase elongation subunit (family B)